MLEIEKSNFSFNRFAIKLQDLGISKKQAEELSFHFLEIDIFANMFKHSINKIMKCKKSQKGKVKDILGDLWGELEHHIVTSHLIPAKRILDKITNKQ